MLNRTDRTEGSVNRTNRTEGRDRTKDGDNRTDKTDRLKLDFKTMHQSKQWTSERI